MFRQSHYRTALSRIFVALLLLSAASRPQAALHRLNAMYTAGQEAPNTILHYTLSIPETVTSNTNPLARFHVELNLPVSTTGPMEFAIPAWTPGYYQILHYEAGIHNLRAVAAEGLSLNVMHSAARTWRVDTSALNTTPVPSHSAQTQTITVSYDVDANDKGLGFFGSSLNARTQQGYINGASALMYPVGQTQSPCTLSLAIPAGWQIATPMEPGEDGHDPPSFPIAHFHAASYDEMVDCPIQLGKFDSITFQENGVDFQCVVVGRQTGNKEGIRASLRRITHAAISLFGSAPFTHYHFIYHLGGSGFFGGLEHHNSTVIHMAAGLGSGTSEDFLTTSAHEFFHAWNVKRLRPEGLGPFDYTREVRTSSLWFAEGVTDYYAQLLLVRSGLKTREWFWHDMLQRIHLLDHTPARVRVPLREASAKAWEGESEGFDGLSYYMKGSLVGLYLDLRLRALTRNRGSLDDVMRRLDASYGSQNRAYPEDAILAAVNAVVGQDMHKEYALLVESTEEIPWNTAFAAIGQQLQHDRAPFLGVKIFEEQREQPGAVIETVEAGHAGARMGLQSGDRLLRLALNTPDNPIVQPISPQNFQDLIASLPLHSPITVEILRGNQALRLSGTIGEVYEHHQLSPLPLGTLSATEQQLANAIQNDMFSGSGHSTEAAQAAPPIQQQNEGMPGI